MKRMLKAGLTIVTLLLALEGVFRLMPVSTGYFMADVTARDPITRRVADINAVSSHGWSMEEPVRRRINNAGFVNAVDYVPDGTRPTVVLISDSQLEAPAVVETNTVHYRLRAALGGEVDVYTFGMSGAPLTQYAVWARHARDSFDPVQTVILLSPNDFDESFYRFGVFPGFHYARMESGVIKPTLREYTRGLGGIVVQNSSFLAYLVHNLELPARIGKALRSVMPAASASSSASKISKVELTALVDWFLDEMSRSGLDASDVIFVLNPPDTSYRDAPSCDSHRARNAQYAHFKARAMEEGYLVFDAAPMFCRFQKSTNGDLVLKDDIHWNAEGHAAMAALLREVLEGRIQR